MTKLKNLTKKQLRAMIAVLVAVAVIMPGLLIGMGIHGKASNTEQAQKRYVNELKTVKTVKPTGNPGEYKVHLEAYNTSDMIEYPPTDIVLVLDLSGSMKDELKKDEYENLGTHTTFSEHKFSEKTSLFDTGSTYHDLYDAENKNNVPNVADSTLARLLVGAGVDHSKNKYIEDPNAPGTFVYIACRFKWDVTHTSPTDSWPYRESTSFGYQYFFTDSLGNQYETEMEWRGGPAAHVESLQFECKNTLPGNEQFLGDTVTIDSYWSRDDDDFKDNSLNNTLWSKRDNLWIKDDNNVWCPVELTGWVIDSNGTWVNVTNTSTAPTEYKYEFVDSDGHTHTAIQGNEEFGAQYGVFQGFKTYKYETDASGNFVLDANGNKKLEVIHAYDEDAPDNYSVESRSLYYKRPSASYSVTRLQAMKEAVEQFILDVHSNAHLRDIDQRVGIVIFNNGAAKQIPLTDVREEVDVNNIIDKLYRFSASGATQIDEGMEDAYEILSTESTGRNKVTIAFTDGVPTNRNGSSYTVEAATRAIGQANRIETLGTADNTSTVYSIGLFTGADSNQMNGSMFYHSGVFHDSEVCTGAVGSKWGRSNIAGLTNSDMSDVDAAATNRFLNLLSSNYPTATNVGIRKMNSLLECWGGQGFEITQNFPKSGENHYFGSQSSEELYNAFQSIANDIAVPENKLGAQTHFVDTVTDSFDIIGDVDVHVEAFDNSRTNWFPTSDVVSVDPVALANKRIDVTGFDYSENYFAAPDTNPAGNYGKKVVVDFTIHTINGFVGGNSVPTNGSDSGIYGADHLLVEDFPVPLRDIDLAYSVEAEDQSVFLNRHANLKEMLSIPETIDGTTNKYANILYTVTDATITDPDASNVVFSYLIPAGFDGENGILSLSEQEVEDLYPILSDNKTYNVVCTVTPIYDGDAEEIQPNDTATVYVYKPVVTVEDQTKSYPEAQQGVDLRVESVVWKAEGKTDIRTDGPEYTYKVKNVTDNTQPSTPIDKYVMGETKDFQVYDFTISGETIPYTADFLCYIKKGVSDDSKYVPVSEYTGTPSADVFEVLTDEEGNIIYQVDDDGNTTNIPVFVMETIPMNKTVNVPARNNDDANVGGFATFINTSDPANAENPRVNGEFTVFVGRPFDLYLSKLFEGNYVVPEGVVFTITGSDGSTQTLTIDQFTHLKSGDIKATAQLNTGVTYTISESFADVDTDPDDYDTTFAGKYITTTIPENPSFDNITGVALEDLDGIYEEDGKTLKNETFQFMVDSSVEPTAVYVAVKNHDNKPDPVVTGISDGDEHVNPFYIVAAVIAVLGGAGTGYAVKRKKETEA